MGPVCTVAQDATWADRAKTVFDVSLSYTYYPIDEQTLVPCMNSVAFVCTLAAALKASVDSTIYLRTCACRLTTSRILKFQIGGMVQAGVEFCFEQTST